MAEGATLRPGQLFAGDYRVERLIARGGMGAVYAAEQVSSGKRRALKVLLPEFVHDRHTRELFDAEARVGSRIHSDHVVEVIASGVDAATALPWIAMEYLEGEDLAAMMERVGAMPPADVLEIAEQLGHAVGAAHAAGVIHCDLKPQNVVVARSRRRGEHFVVKVLDFGIARVLDADRTSATVREIAGSHQWMAPEQGEEGERLRPSADVWPLGLIVFKMLTGRSYWLAANAPKGQSSRAALLREVLINPLATASERAAQLGRAHAIPPGFDAWFACCVERDPGLRFPDANAAVAALRSVLGGAAPAREPAPPARLSFPVIPVADVTPPAQAAWPRDHAPTDARRARDASLAAATLVAAVLGITALVDRARPASPARVVTAPAAMMPAVTPSPPAEAASPAAASAPARDALSVAEADPMERARRCRATAADARTRDRCIVAALLGHARTMEEQGLLAATFQSMGRAHAAARAMSRYVRHYPSGPLAPAFREYLAAHPADAGEASR